MAETVSKDVINSKEGWFVCAWAKPHSSRTLPQSITAKVFSSWSHRMNWCLSWPILWRHPSTLESGVSLSLRRMTSRSACKWSWTPRAPIQSWRQTLLGRQPVFLVATRHLLAPEVKSATRLTISSNLFSLIPLASTSSRSTWSRRLKNCRELFLLHVDGAQRCKTSKLLCKGPTSAYFEKLNIAPSNSFWLIGRSLTWRWKAMVAPSLADGMIGAALLIFVIFKRRGQVNPLATWSKRRCGQLFHHGGELAHKDHEAVRCLAFHTSCLCIISSQRHVSMKTFLFERIYTMEFKGTNFQNSDCFDVPTAKFEFKPLGIYSTEQES